MKNVVILLIVNVAVAINVIPSTHATHVGFDTRIAGKLAHVGVRQMIRTMMPLTSKVFSLLIFMQAKIAC